MNIENILFQVSVWTLPVLIAVTLHEAAHGWVAWKLGDDTAYRLGRVTFNPLRHIDPFGTILLPAMLLLASGGSVMFGAAKPVPVNFRGLRRPRRDMVLVAAAGPAANLVIAMIAAALFHVLPILSPDFGQWVGYNLQNAIWINVLLCVFNMIPIPPLDGGRVAGAAVAGPGGPRAPGYLHRPRLGVCSAVDRWQTGPRPEPVLVAGRRAGRESDAADPLDHGSRVRGQ